METGTSIAQTLIRRCAELHCPFLDLGNLGLTELPAALFDLTHLQGLNLGRCYYGNGIFPNVP